MIGELPLFPVGASTDSSRVDALFIGLVVVCGLLATVVAVLVITWAVRWRRRPGQLRGDVVKEDVRLEIAWTAAIAVLFLAMFAFGGGFFVRTQRAPPNAIEVSVLAKQWMWTLEHASGRRELNELHIPVGVPVRLTMISQDVIHSFYVPAFRIKQDVLPGRYTTVWFEATRPGTYHLFCAEYCGTKHSAMVGQVIVLERRDYQAWLEGGQGPVPGAESGRALFERLGCPNCHFERAGQRAPPLAGVYGSTVTLSDGKSVVADESYLRESILNPQAKIVRGYAPIMPTYKGRVSEQELLHLIGYLKSLARPKPAGEPESP